ncbi:MAG: helix-turn-helix transcriptional regulator [Chryseolinea sp.]
MEIVEIGQKIKDVFDKRDMRLTEFADELGTVRQNVYRIFKKRHVDTGLLLKISRVLNFNFFEFYVSSPDDTENEKVATIRNEVAEYQRQLDLSRKEIDYLRKIIKLMEEKAELVQQLGNEAILLQ